MIKRSHIRQFLAVVDAGSFTHAAQHIRVTQPALSTGVAELERLVGTQLFIRSRRQIRLRSEEHTSELQSLMRISYAVFCLKKKKKLTNQQADKTPTN